MDINLFFNSKYRGSRPVEGVRQKSSQRSGRMSASGHQNNRWLFSWQNWLALVLVFALLGVFANSISGASQTQNFHPHSCLGGWQKTDNATGTPEVNFSNTDPENFNNTNSALLSRGEDAEIICGQFGASIPENRSLEEVTLKLSLAFSGDGQTESGDDTSTTSTPNQSSNEDASGQASSTQETPPSASSTATTTETATSTDEDASTSTNATSSSENATTTESEDTPTSTPNHSDASSEATGQASSTDSDTTGETSTTSTSGESQASRYFDLFAGIKSFLPQIFSPVLATTTSTTSTPNQSSNEDASGQASSTQDNSTSSTSSSETVPANSDILVIEFTTGSGWQELTAITVDEADLATARQFTLPEVTKAELANLQVRLRPESTIENRDVYLEGLTLSLTHISSEDQGSSTNQPESEPQVQGIDAEDINVNLDSVLRSNKQNFQATENPQFIFDFSNISTTTEATSGGTEDQLPDNFLQPRSSDASLLDGLRAKIATAGRSLKNIVSNSLPRALAQTGTDQLSVVSSRVIGPRGQPTKSSGSIDVVGNQVSVNIPRPDTGFTPGKHTLYLTIRKSGKIFTTKREFRWGVLAVNLDKSIYQTGEEGYLQIAALDDLGNTICDADLELTLTAPSGDEETFTTDDGINTSATCGPNNVTDNPDYFLYRTFEEAGEYELTLENQNNGYEIEDSFEVKENPAVSLERSGATRINPFRAEYAMTFRVRLGQGFAGEITETIPSSFELPQADSASYTVEEAGDKKKLIWQVDLSAGEEAVLSYTYQAPKISPQFYLLGPASLGSGGSVEFAEARQWQIAADAATTQGATNNEAVSQGGWSSPANAHGTTDDNSYATVSAQRDDPNTASDYKGYGLGSQIPSGSTIDQVEILPQWFVDSCSGFDLDIEAVVSGTTQGTHNQACQTGESTTAVDVTSDRSWSRSDLLDGTFEVRATANSSGISGSPNNTYTMNLDKIPVRVTYTPPPISYEQSGYRLFANSSSTDVGSALAAENASTTLTSAGENFRLRTLLHVSGADLATSSQDFKLQFAQKGGGTCGAPSGTYTDVTSSTGIAYNDNTTPTDGSALTANANDPTHSGHTVNNQTYEEANNFTNSQSAINSGADGMWDFSLTDNNATDGNTYCLRVVKSGGGTLSTYSQYPEVTIFDPPEPVFENSGYRFFENTNSIDAFSALASQNTAITLTSSGQNFRLRGLFHVSSADLTQSGEDFKLQFADKTGFGSCSTIPDGDYAAVTENAGSATTSTETKIDDASDFGALPSTGARQIIRDSSGRLHAVLNDGGDIEVWESSDGSSWSLGGSSTGATSAGSISIAVAIDSTDILHIGYASSTDMLYTTYDTDTDSFGSKETVDTAGGSAQRASIAVDGNDVPHMAYSLRPQQSASESITYANRVGGSWSTTDSGLGAGDSGVAGVDITINEDSGGGAPVISYEDINIAINQSVSLGSDNDPVGDSTPFNSVTIKSEAGTSAGSSVAVDSSGNTYVAYIQDSGTASLVTMGKHNDGDAWESGSWATTTSSNVGQNPNIVISGTSVYVFYENDEDDIAYETFTNGSFDGENVIQTGTYEDVKAKWSHRNNYASDGTDYGGSSGIPEIDYLFSDGTDVWYNKLKIGSTIAFNSNDSVTDGTALTDNANDPTHSGHTINNQTYEEANNFTNSQSAIATGEDGLWDFSLTVDANAPTSTTYCIKPTKADGTELNTYSQYPEVTTHDGTGGGTVTCSTAATSTEFGTILSDSVYTASSNATTTVSCTSGSGCELYVKDTGDGSGNPGLWNSTDSYLIDSQTETLSSGSEGYGIQAATTTAGSDGALTLASVYDKTGDSVGALSTTDAVLASSTGSVTNREVVVSHKAVVSNLTTSGSYADTITYSCVAQ